MIDLDRYSDLELPDAAAADAARARQDRLTKPTGALGRLEPLSVWWCSVRGECPAPPPQQPTVVLLAGDHGVAASGVSAYPPAVTAQMVLNFLAGGAAVNVLARQANAAVHVYDISVDVDYADLGAAVPEQLLRHRIRRGSGDISVSDALTDDEVRAALAAGAAIADAEIDAGADLLLTGDMGIGNTTPATTLIHLLTGGELVDLVGRGTGVDDAGWMRKTAAIRDAARRGRSEVGDPVRLLATVGGADFAAMVGLLLQAAARRTPVLLDGIVSGAAALVADRISFRAREWWLAGHRSTEPAHAAALDRLRLDPVLDFSLRLGEGTGALLALPILSAAAATLAEMATFDSAGVSDRPE